MLDVPRIPPQGDNQETPWSDAWTTSAGCFWHSHLPDVWARMKVQRSPFFTDHAERLAIGEGQLVNREYCLQAQILLHHTSPPVDISLRPYLNTLGQQLAPNKIWPISCFPAESHTLPLELLTFIPFAVNHQRSCCDYSPISQQMYCQKGEIQSWTQTGHPALLGYASSYCLWYTESMTRHNQSRDQHKPRNCLSDVASMLYQSYYRAWWYEDILYIVKTL